MPAYNTHILQESIACSRFKKKKMFAQYCNSHRMALSAVKTVNICCTVSQNEPSINNAIL